MTKQDVMTPPTGLDLMRAPFKPNEISKLPKPTKQQTDKLREAQSNRDFSLGVRCKLCGQWHHKDVVHLDYVGHAALTNRLLDCDPGWNWEPVGFDEKGQPLRDQNGGMWIRLTVCGQTRLGYGDAEGKSGGNAVKEVIGDALRNAAMRFGAALDLWHKGDLHAEGEDPEPKFDPRAAADRIITAIRKRSGNRANLEELWKAEKATMADLTDQLFEEVKGEFSKAMPAPANDLGDDTIPY